MEMLFLPGDKSSINRDTGEGLKGGTRLACASQVAQHSLTNHGRRNGLLLSETCAECCGGPPLSPPQAGTQQTCLREASL